MLLPEPDRGREPLPGQPAEPVRASSTAARCARAPGRCSREIGADIDVDLPIAALSTGQEQMVQIAGAVGTGARIIVMDEPTSSLASAEAERLFELIDRLKARGVTLIYVSHRLEEIFRLCDRVTVLRDGQHIETADIARHDHEHDRPADDRPAGGAVLPRAPGFEARAPRGCGSRA